jgi:hypothetical protein
MRILLYASELASCIGRHRYQDVPSAKVKVWSRTDPDGYEAAKRRTAYAEREELPSSVNISEAVQCGPLRVDAEIKRVMHQPLTVSDEAIIVRARAAVSKEDLVSVCVPERVSLSVTGRARVEVAVAAAQDAKRDGATPAEVDSLLKKAVECARVGDCSASADLQATVFKARGCAGESSATDAYERHTAIRVVHRNDKFYKRCLRSDDSVAVGGRVDGISADGTKLVEVKCRQRRLFSYLPEYENVQIHSYMWLTGIHECELVQRYGGETRIDSYTFSADEWERISDAACAFAQEVRELMECEQKQDELLEACKEPPPPPLPSHKRARW